MRALPALALLLGLTGLAYEVALAPADPAALGSWAQVVQALRLHPTPPSPLRFEGPALALRLYGEVGLGQARYPLLLGITPQNEAGLWLDRDRDGRLLPEEELPKARAAEALLWTATLLSEPAGAPAFSYPLGILWPEGRSYVFLLGGAPRAGEFQGHALVLVDGDLDGVFGTSGDFFGVDVDKDGRIYAEPDGHERFKLTEPFTLPDASFRVRPLAPDGSRVRLEPAPYVAPKVPLIPGSPAPDFSFRNFLDGRPMSLGQFRGQVVLLDFWATWCPPCLASLPKLRALYEEFRPKGFEIVGVSLDESGEDLRRVLSTYGILWPNAFFGRRWDHPVASLYRVQQIPTTYLLDRRGVIRFRDLQGEELRAAIAALLAEADAPASPAPLALVLPEQVRLNPRGATRFSVTVANRSAVPAQEVALAWEGLPEGLRAEGPPPFALAPGEARELELTLALQEPRPAPFARPATLVLRYRYGSGPSDEVVQRAPLVLVLAEEGAQAGIPWWAWGLLVLGLALAAWLLGRGGFFLWPLLFLGFLAGPGGPV